MIKRIRHLVAKATYLTLYAIVRFALHASQTVLLSYVEPVSEDLANGQWYTFDEICALGHPEDILRQLMPLACYGQAGMHRYFDARLRSDVPVGRPPATFDLSHGMTPKNAHLYEFRLIREQGARREIPEFDALPAFA
jgi:hypothetical protein